MFENWKTPVDKFSKYKDIPSRLILKPASELTEKPFLSIMIPTYRRADMLRGTIQSAISQIDPGISYEVVVVDNDSEVDKATVECVKPFVESNRNVYYYRNAKNIGMFGNWNRCLELAQGKWVAMLHDDDQFQTHYVKEVGEVLPTLQAGVLGVFPMFMEEINGEFIETEKCRKANSIKRILTKLSGGVPLRIGIREYRRNIAPNATGCLFNKSYAMEAGGFDEDTNVDYTFYDKLGALYGSYIIPHMLTIRGISQENLSNDWETVIHYAKIMKQFTFELGKELPNSKDWISDYSTVAYINNNKEKYSSAIPRKDLCERIGVPRFWTSVPNFFIQILQMFFWLQVIFLKQK